MAYRTDRNDASRGGFTLVELAIVFTIIGFLVTVSLSTGRTMIEQQRVSTTYGRLELIMKALDDYARIHRQLPCPADPTVSTDNTTFGDGTGTGGNSSGAAECTASNITPSPVAGTTTQVLRGALPVKQLGLASTLAVDGWGRKFSYVVSESFTVTGSTVPSVAGFANTSTNGAIQLVRWNGAFNGAVTDANERMASDAAVLVFSHGPTGWGGYSKDGSTKIPDTATRAETPSVTNLDSNCNARFCTTGNVATTGADWLNQEFTNDDANGVFITAYYGVESGLSGSHANYHYMNERIMDYRMRWQLGKAQ